MAASSGEYNLSVILKTIDRMSGGFNAPIAKVKLFGSESRKALQDYKKLRAEVGRPLNTSGLDRFDAKLHKVTTDIKALAREQGKLGKRYDKLADNTGLDRQLQQLRTYRREMRAVARDSEAMRSTMRSGGATMPTSPLVSPRRRREPLLGRLGAAGDLFMVGRQGFDIWRDRAESLHKYSDAALEVIGTQQKFYALNLTTEENAKAFNAVRRTVNELNGVSLSAATETITDLHTAIGSLDEAIEALPIASKYRFGFETLFGDKFDQGQIEQNIQSGFKFLEMIGALRATGGVDALTGKHKFQDSDRQRMEQFFSRTAQMTAASGGRVTPADMLQMAKTGGTALQGLSLEGLTSLQSPLTELGGARTGTALQSLFQNVVAGRVQQKGLMEWQRLGLLDTSKVEFNKSGIVKRMDAGAIPIGDLLQESPLKFADALAAAMKSHGVNTQDPKAVIKELGALKMPRTAAEITSLFINQRDRVTKETGIVTKAKGIEGLNQQAIESPMGKIVQYQKAIENWKAATGMSLVEIGVKLTKEWTPFVKLMTDHPDLSIGLVGVQKVAFGLLETVALLNQLRVAASLSEIAAAGGTAAGSVSRFTKSWNYLANGPRLLQFSIVLAMAGLTYAEFVYLMNTIKEYEDSQKTRQDMSAIGGKAYADIRKRAGLGDQNAAAQLPGLATGTAATYVDALKQGGMFGGAGTWIANAVNQTLKGLSYAGGVQQAFSAASYFHSGKERTLVPELYPMFRGQDRIEKMRQDMPELRYPEVMSATRRMIGGQSQEGLAKFDEIAKQAFGDSFKASMQDTAANVEKMGQSALPVSEAFDKIIPPAAALPGSFTNLGSAVDSATFKLNTMTINPVIVQGPMVPPAAGGAAAAPGSAAGSVIHRDGWLKAHRGNVLFPAALSRRSPGDWLTDLASIRTAAAARGAGVSVRTGNVIVHGGGDVETVIAKVQAAHARQIAQLREQLSSPRHIGRMRDRYNQEEDERA